jgi:methyl coenzyme M reductase beta subunit
MLNFIGRRVISRHNKLFAPSLVGALCFSRGEQRFSVAEKSLDFDLRFSAGLEKARAKARLSKWIAFPLD